MTMTSERVADGVYRCGSERVNWYLLETADGITVVDTGFPAHWEQFDSQLETMGYGVADVDACILTHAHPDHAGFAERLHREAGVPVWVHEADAAHARGDGEVPLTEGLVRLWRPELARYAVEFVRSGGLSVPPLTTFRTVTDGETLDVPGSPRVVHTPGHSEGHVAYHFPEQEALLCGDELVTTDFVAGRGHRPQLLADWFNLDHDRAYESLSRLESIGEVLILPGHGEPWHGHTETAVEHAREREKQK
ncbi:MBL fold metallo-hydrolase [Natrinema sp. CBA1119]|uniref:MBL fold metallo-hydrolase n=1 Tax=Natrinema sp. CBA1119 TaxID=1608465 RepID=UPI000BFA3A6E|nr:MBL fold metallo-hydrolase [Natrinema sp. CBA1119]PGF16675.1 MBL fold metallo-hydrolase [Natrinema sp. CBA1119]